MCRGDNMADANSTDVQDDKKPSSGYSNVVMLLLFIVYTFNFLDRQIISILAIPIQEDTGWTDEQMGLLGGIAFAALYSTLGIPIAALADKVNRTWIMTVSLSVWSAATMLSGMAQNYTQMFLARMGVGIGEAGGVAPSYSLITDYFPPEKRARAMAIYSLGIPVGSAIGFIAGAHIAAGVFSESFDWRTAFLIVGFAGLLIAPIFKLVVKEPKRGAFDVAIPVDSPPENQVQEFSPKKTTTLSIVGAILLPMPSLLALAGESIFGTPTQQSAAVLIISIVAAVVAGWFAGRFWGRLHTIKPLLATSGGLFLIPALIAWLPVLFANQEGALMSAALWVGLQVGAGLLFGLYFAYMREFMSLAMEKPAFWFLIFGASASSMMGYGIFFWLPSFFARSFGLSLVETGWTIGGVIFFAGALGILFGGIMGDWMGKRKRSAFAIVPAVAFLITVPFYWGAVLSSSVGMAIALFFIPTALGLAWLGPTLTAFQHMFPVHMRTRASSIFLLINNLLGIGGGVYVLGKVSHVLAPTFGEESLRYSILLGSLLYFVAAGLFFVASKHLQNDWHTASND
ncbi:MAG: MFS transporter [Maricaulis sp.]|nr:MFS transporter [Maricaulis sp.]